jgi:hypothetical protein
MRGRPRSSTRIWADSVPSTDAKQLTPQLRRLGFTKSGNDPLPNPSATVNLGSKPAQIKLVATTPNFGGRRFWWQCPHCGRRVRKLFQTGGELTSPLAGPAWGSYTSHSTGRTLSRRCGGRFAGGVQHKLAAKYLNPPLQKGAPPQ